MAALQVASMLDEVAFNNEWRDTITKTLNNSLMSIKVSSGYDIVVTITNRNYLLESGDSNKLTVSRIIPSGVAKAVSKAKVRVVVNTDALKEVEDMGDDWNNSMISKRKLQIQGNQAMYNKLDKELADHMSALQNKVEAAGPGEIAIKDAIEEHNAKAADVSKESEFSEQLAVVQVANLTADAADKQPALMKITGWVFYAAISDMQGNAGQSNYGAANCFLDALAFHMRTTNSDNFYPVAVMWGAIGNLGMRLKAFGSLDMLAMVDNTDDVLMTPLEAQQAIGLVLRGYAPEWLGIWKNTPEYNQEYLLNWSPLRHMGGRVGPWGKGKGGGVSIDESDLELSYYGRARAANQKVSEEPAHTENWLFPGRCVRIHGLVLDADMNGVIGTLVEESEPGVWHVRLEDDHGEKLLKAKNLATLSGAPVVESKADNANKKKSQIVDKMLSSKITISGEKASAVAPFPRPELCIAGTWADWMPQDMQWDAQQECHTCEVQLSGETKFGVNRGKASAKKWAVRPKQWIMGDVAGLYQIKVFLKNRMVDKVAWDKLA